MTVLADHWGPIQISTNADVQGWHRHATLVMLAHFFVVRETPQLPKKRPGLTVPRTCLLVDAALPRTGSPAARALAIVDYRRAHAQRRRKSCAYLFRHYEVSLHYYDFYKDVRNSNCRTMVWKYKYWAPKFCNGRIPYGSPTDTVHG